MTTRTRHVRLRTPWHGGSLCGASKPTNQTISKKVYVDTPKPQVATCPPCLKRYNHIKDPYYPLWKRLEELQKLTEPTKPWYQHPTPLIKAFISHHDDNNPDIYVWSNHVLGQVQTVINHVLNTTDLTNPYEVKNRVDIVVVNYHHIRTPYGKLLKGRLGAALHGMGQDDVLILPTWTTVGSFRNMVETAARRQGFTIQLLT